MSDALPPEWVFGYGSLMWNPGFDFIDRQPATLHGYHRAFCIYSHHYRGTPAQPGLVLGLTPGGACRGMAYRIAENTWADVVSYLDERELIGYAYRPARLAVRFDGDARADVHTYVADEHHPHYAGELPMADSAELIIRAEGASGSNRDYVVNVIRELETHGYPDPHLHELLALVRDTRA